MEINAMEDSKKDLRYARARQKWIAVKSFYTHLTVYLIVNAFIIFMIFKDVPAGERELMMFSTPLFWGLGLSIHAFRVFGAGMLFSKEWEERKIREFMKKDRFNI